MRRLTLILAVGMFACGYWSTRPMGDTAPTAWGQNGLPPTAVPAEVNTSVEERLHNLKRLHDGGLISDAEYRDRRAKVLADSF
jgi:hypothetical protein